VVIPLIATPRPAILFVRRGAHLRRNAGQIGFPGGLIEAKDNDDRLRTALRELQEELGIPESGIAIVHRLPEAQLIRRGMRVTPFVGVMEVLPPLRIDADELDGAVCIPLAAILAPGALHEGIETFAGLRIPTWQFDYETTHIWGATARILRMLLEAVAENAGLRATLQRRGITFVPSPAVPMRRPSGP